MKRLVYLFTLATLVLGAAACGDDGGSTATAGDGASGATTTEAGGGELRGELRVVSLSPTATESLFAIGAGDLVVAVDDQSTYPAEAPMTDLSGYTPNIEAIAGYEPDLVIVQDGTGLADQLAQLDIDVLVQPAAANLDAAYAQIIELGTATGHQDDAATLVADMKASIEASKAKITKPAVDVKIYHELDNTLYSITGSTFIGELYALVGVINIADAADTDGTGYPQLTAEYIVAEDPDFIFLADTKCCSQDAATVASRPGWSSMKAVGAGNVVELDDDVASRWGPRTPQLFDAIASAVAELVHA